MADVRFFKTLILTIRVGVPMSLTLEKHEDWFELAITSAPISEVNPPIKRTSILAWDDEDEEEVEPAEADEDEDVDITVPDESEDDPFDDFDDEDFDDNFDDDFEEELDDDYEIEPDDSEMFPAQGDDD